MLKNGSRTVNTYLFLCVLLASVAVAGYGLASDTASRSFALAASGLSSLIASLVFAVLSAVVFRDRQDQMATFIGRFDKMAAIKLRHIAGKNDDAPDYWTALASSTSDNLDICGPSLTQWTVPQYAKPLCDAIRQLLKSKRRVRLLILAPPDDDRCLPPIVDCISSAIADLPPNERTSFECRTLPTRELFRYTMFANQASVVYMPILHSKAKHSPLLEFDEGSSCARAIREDFDQLFRSGDDYRLPAWAYNATR